MTLASRNVFAHLLLPTFKTTDASLVDLDKSGILIHSNVNIVLQIHHYSLMANALLAQLEHSTAQHLNNV